MDSMKTDGQAANKLPVPLYKLKEVPDADFAVSGLNPDITPRGFQKVGAGAICFFPRMILGDDVGTGKSGQTLMAIKKLKDLGRVQLTILVCTKPLMQQWANEAHKWFPNGFKVQVVEGSKAQRYKIYENVKRNHGHPLNNVDILLMTYANVRIDLEHLEKLPYDWTIYDEASVLKNLKTDQTKAAQKLSGEAKRVLCLTATPIQTKLEEYHAIMTVVKPEVLGNRSSFERNFCLTEQFQVTTKNGRKIRVSNIYGYKNLPLFKQAVREYILQRTVDDVGASLPELIGPLDRYVELTDIQRMRYDEIANGLVMLSEDPDATLSEEAIQRVLRLNQIADANELVYPNEPSSAKLDELAYLLANELSGEQVVVFSKWTQALELIRTKVIEKQKIPYGLIYGGQDSALTEKHRLDFQAGKTRVMLISPAAEMGVNLGAGKYLICFDTLYNEGRMRQLYGRIRRLDSAHPQAIIIRLVAKDTMEENILQLLEKRAALIDYFDNPEDLKRLKMRELMAIINKNVSLLD